MREDSSIQDGLGEMRAAMLSYYASSEVQQLKPAPTRAELGIYDEIVGEVNAAQEALSKQADRRETEEAPGVKEAEEVIKPLNKRQRQAKVTKEHE